MNVLPLETLLKIGAFAGECFPLSNTCKSNLDVTHELHFKISMKDSALGVSSLKDPSERLSCGQMGAQNFPGRALPSGRVVTRITVNDCTDPRDKAVCEGPGGGGGREGGGWVNVHARKHSAL